MTCALESSGLPLKKAKQSIVLRMQQYRGLYIRSKNVANETWDHLVLGAVHT
jgi:hypothetical protein